MRACELSEDAAIDTPAWRAAALANLGEIDAARDQIDELVSSIDGQWAGDGAASRDAIARWLIDGYPIRNPATWSRFYDGLEAGGLISPARALTGE